MKDIVVLYHKNCDDGFGAAWAAWKKLGDAADYIPVVHQEPPPEGLTGKTIYLLDFCYNKETMQQLMAANTEVTAIDHHAMGEPVVRLTKKGVFDNSHSGAVLSWNFFHSEKPIPQLLLHIEDGDLWKFVVPHTKEITVALSLAAYDFEVWSGIARDLENTEQKLKYIQKGETIVQYTDQQMAFLIENASDRVLFEGHETLAINCPRLDFNSALAARLVRKLPPIAIVWSMRRGKIVVSLRSDGTVDVASLAQKYGGGGHKAAAGFSIPDTEPFPWQPIKS